MLWFANAQNLRWHVHVMRWMSPTAYIHVSVSISVRHLASTAMIQYTQVFFFSRIANEGPSWYPTDWHIQVPIGNSTPEATMTAVCIKKFGEPMSFSVGNFALHGMGGGSI